jgi:hypothetical protein
MPTMGQFTARPHGLFSPNCANSRDNALHTAAVLS